MNRKIGNVTVSMALIWRHPRPHREIVVFDADGNASDPVWVFGNEVEARAEFDAFCAKMEAGAA